MSDARADPAIEDPADPVASDGEGGRRRATVPPPPPGYKPPSDAGQKSSSPAGQKSGPEAPAEGPGSSPAKDPESSSTGQPPGSSPVGEAPLEGRSAARALAPVSVTIAAPSVVDGELSRAAADSAEARAERLAAELAAATDKATIAQLAYELGELSETRLSQTGRAVKAYGQALAADPSHRANLWAIRRVFYRRGLWPNLVKLIQAEARLAKDGDERADLLLEKAFIHEVHQHDASAARDAISEAIEADPGSLTALLRRERLALADKDRDTLTAVWQRLAERSEIPERKLCYRLDLAHLAAGEGEAGLERASDLLAEAAALGVRSETVAIERERLGERRGDEAEILAALETRIACIKARLGQPGSADEDAAERTARLEVIALRRRQARVARGAGDADAAWDYLRDAAAISPEEPLVLADLADLAEKLGKFEELAELCEGLGSAAQDPARVLVLSLRRVDALLKGGRPGEAAALLAHLEEVAPGYLPAVAVAERDALMRGDMAALAAAYARAAGAAATGGWRAPKPQGQESGPDGDVSDDAFGIAAEYLAASDIYALYLGDAERARELCREALATAPELSPALWAMVEICEVTGHLEDAATILENALAAAADPGYVLERLAQIYQTLGRAGDLVRVLEDLVARRGDGTDLRWRLADALADAARPADRIATLTDIAGLSDVPGERAAALLLAAEIADRDLGEPARALPLCREAVAIAPDDDYAAAYRVDLCRRSAAWDELVDALREGARKEPASDNARRALREAAEVAFTRLGRPGEAADVYREILTHHPGDPAAVWGAAEALAAVGDVSGAAAFFENAAEIAATPAEAALAFSEAGDIALAHNRPDDAVTAYRRAAAADPESLYAPVALAGLAARAGDAGLHSAALVAIADGVKDAGVGADILERAGWLALAAGDGSRATAAFIAATTTDPARPGPALGRALAAASARDTVAFGAALADLAEHTIGAQMASAAALRSASLADADGDADIAQERAWRRATLDHPAALCATLDYAPPPVSGEPADVAARWLKLAELFGRRAALCGSPALAQSFALDRVDALEAAGHLAEAGRAAVDVIAKTPDSLRALCALHRIAGRGGDRNAVATAALALARVVRGTAAKLELYREAAAIFDDELGNTDAAVTVYRHILVEDPGAAEYERLHDIYAGHGDARGLFDLLSHRLADLDRVAPHARSRAPLLYERALLRDEAGDLTGAAVDLAALVAADGDHLAGLRRFADVLSRLRKSRDAAAAWRRYLERESDPAEIASARMALADIVAGPLADPAAGAALLGQVLSARPADVALRERRCALLLAAGDREALVEAYDELSRLRPGDAAAAADQVARARILAELGDGRASRAALERARALSPTSVEVVFGLADLAAQEGVPGAAREVLLSSALDLRRAIAGAPGDGALYESLARIAERAGDAPTAAVARAAHLALGGMAVDPGPLGPAPAHPVSSADFDAQVVHHDAREVGLWSAIAEAVVKILGADVSGLGLSRGDRQGKNLGRRYAGAAAWIAAFELSDLEVYVTDAKPDLARAVAGEQPILVLGAHVAEAGGAAARFRLGRALGEARAGLAGLSPLVEAGDLAVWIAAACRVAGIDAPPRALAQVADRAGEIEARARELARVLSRSGKKALARAATGPVTGPMALWRGAQATLARCGLLAVGDLGAAVGVLTAEATPLPVMRDLCAWAVSDAYARVRAAIEGRHE
ncbi:MAG TPA: tetratricopeptide repeat protein [Kofleriaceae bacterium]|nr:tetratricopeptide repeat protein [Kofleriaceae bacterium]